MFVMIGRRKLENEQFGVSASVPEYVKWHNEVICSHIKWI